MKRKKLSAKERRKIVESVVGKVPWKQFKSGIYNYCDRWCEKCNKTNKCYLFWSMQKEDKELLEQGIDSKTLDGSLKVVGNSLGQTRELLEKISEAEGIDLTITPEFEAECDEREKLVDPHKEPIYLKARKISREIGSWLSKVPSLDIKEYREAYENLNWHYLIIDRKIARAVSGKKEAKLEKGDLRQIELKDSKMSAWVAYRSTKICADSLEFIDQYVRDFRIAPMANKCRELIEEIDKELL